MWRSMTMWRPGREVYRPVWMVVCTSGGLYGQPSGQNDISTSDCVSALLRERHSLPARSETLSEVAQFSRDFRVVCSERHRGDLELKSGYRNSNLYHLNIIDQLAPSRIEFQTRKSSGTWSWASTMRTLPFWSGYGPSTATTMNDNDGTVGIDDGRWRRGHRAAIDYSRAEQVFDSITTRYPREPIASSSGNAVTSWLAATT